MGFILIAIALTVVILSNGSDEGGKNKPDTRDYWTRMKEDETWLYNAHKIESNNRYDELGR